MTAVIRTLNSAEATRRLDRAGIANARMNTVADVLSHPQLAGRWWQVPTPGGPVRTLRPSGLPPSWYREPGAVPALGQHPAAGLAALGLSDRACHQRSEC